jgi:hypothetical protein
MISSNGGEKACPNEGNFVEYPDPEWNAEV